VTNVQHGSLTLNADGSFTYTPAANYSGADSFVYRASDGTASSPDTTVSFTVNPVNDAPTAVADSYNAAAGNTLAIVTAQGVLKNDTDPESNALTAVVATNPTHGTLNLNTNGGFTYTPDSGFIGSDSFTYRADDGTSLSAPVAVTIQVAANQFTVAQGSVAGTTIGTVQTTVTGASRLYQIHNSGLNANLVLAPDDHLEGDPSASVVIIEYLDYGCPHCRDAHPLVQQMLSEFAGQLLVVRRHFPIPVTSQSVNGARAAEAAARQGQFDAMTDLLFENQTAWRNLADPLPSFESYATSLGLNLIQFRADYADPAVTTRINRDKTSAIALGAGGTPAFFVNGTALATVPTTAAAFESVIQSAITASTDIVSIDRRTGVIKVLKPSGLNSGNAPLEYTVNVTNTSGNAQAVTVKITVTPPPPPAPAAPASEGMTAHERDSLAVASVDALFGNAEEDGLWY
jgi:VCBS repeat-containing protein